MSLRTFPIVGAFYRPPAQALLAVLPVGAPLTLIAEPDNPYDPNAIAIWLKSKDIPTSAHAELENTLLRFGFDLDQIFAQENWHIGYIPKEIAATLRASGIIQPDEEIEVTFALAPSGTPRVAFAEAPSPLL
jgi:hypothetical protein